MTNPAAALARLDAQLETMTAQGEWLERLLFTVIAPEPSTLRVRLARPTSCALRMRLGKV